MSSLTSICPIFEQPELKGILVSSVCFTVSHTDYRHVDAVNFISRSASLESLSLPCWILFFSLSTIICANEFCFWRGPLKRWPINWEHWMEISKIQGLHSWTEQRYSNQQNRHVHLATKSFFFVVNVGWHALFIPFTSAEQLLLPFNM